MNQVLAPSPRPRRFLEDNRGAIAIMGVLIGAVLAAVLFHIMNCGFGILWREHAQDAADATAYEAAVWNARGMNLVVALNIMIALVMAVLICWRIVIIFTIVAVALCSIACAVPGGEEACDLVPSLGRAVGEEFKQDGKVAARVYQVIKLLHDGQKVIAAAAPIMGTLASIDEANKHQAKFGIGFGTYLLPVVNLPSGKSPGKSCANSKLKKGTSSASAWGDQLGKPVSLPVVDKDDVNTLCGEAGVEIPNLIFGIAGSVLKKMGIDINVGPGGNSDFGTVFNGIFSAPGAAEFFCGVWNDVIDQSIDSNTHCGKGDSDCQKAQDQTKSDAKGKQGTKLDKASLHWADIWGPAVNGGLFTQSWGFVISDRSFYKELDRGVGIANFVPGGSIAPGGPAPNGFDIDDTGITIAEAEVYFDCSGTWSDSGSPVWHVGDSGCMGRAPWSMAWRARLRRVHDPVDFVVDDLGETLTGALYGAIDSSFVGAVASKFGPVRDALGHQSGRLVQPRITPELQAERDKLRKELVPQIGAQLPVRSAAAWVDDEYTAGVQQLIH
jgi:hypothetical protein